MIGRLDVPSLSRCRKLAAVMKGVKPAAWWYQGACDLCIVGNPTDNVPAYTLGQMLDFARRCRLDPVLSLYRHLLAADLAAGPSDDEYSQTGTTWPNALADTLIAWHKEENR